MTEVHRLVPSSCTGFAMELCSGDSSSLLNAHALEPVVALGVRTVADLSFLDLDSRGHSSKTLLENNEDAHSPSCLRIVAEDVLHSASLTPT